MAWENRRVKDVATSIIGLTYSPEDIVDEKKGILVLRSGNIQDGKTVFSDNVYVDAKIPQGLHIQKGDILMCARNGSAQLVGKCSYIDENYKNCTWGAFMTVIRSRYGKYLYWVFNSCILADCKGMFQTSTVNQLTGRILDNISIPFPPESIQQKIANFLDAKTQNIDARIELLEKKKERYTTLRKALINEAVDGEGKEWKTVRMKDVFSFSKGLSITKENLEENGIPVISYGQIHSKQNKGVQINDSLIRFVNESYLETGEKSLTQQYDFIFADTSEDLEGCGNNVYVDRNETLFAGYHTIILRNKKHQDNKFLAYLFLSDNWRTQIRQSVCGIKVFSITQKDLAPVEIVLPSYEEQIQISKYLDKKTSAIDLIVPSITKEIVSLKTYRRALINEAVTGN